MVSSFEKFHPDSRMTHRPVPYGSIHLLFTFQRSISSMDDFFVDLKRKHWHAWFNEPFPMLQGMTPPQPAQTTQGRRLLDDLLRFYDHHSPMESSPGFIDANVPSKWAKWKLGYGPGSASEFVEEEAIFNSVDPRQATRRMHPAP